MRILLMGAPTTNLYRCFGKSTNINGGGWVENLVNALCGENIKMFVAAYADFTDRVEIKEFNGVHYCALPARIRDLSVCNAQMCHDLQELVERVQPDVVHIIGTEKEFDLKLLEAAGAEKTVVSITGMVGYIARHFLAGIDEKNFRVRSIGDILRRTGGPIEGKKRFARWGVYEKQLIQKAKYVMGRTTWDYACVKQLNPEIDYTYCGEILNPLYFDHQWQLDQAKPHRIFVSQGNYPLKGIHILLEAFPAILKRYPDAEIYVAGNDIMTCDTVIKRIKQTTYAQYLNRLLKKLQIPKEKVKYTGPLAANEMLEQYLQCHVSVMPSAIENSPNSLGEAMLLGVPCVASCVGGMQDMLRDRTDGYLYPFDEAYMLAYYVCDIFEREDLARTFSENAREMARKRFDVEQVKETTLSVYRKIVQTNGSDKVL